VTAIPTDEALMRQFQAGDRSAFAVLVERHRVHAIHFCQRMLRDPDEAEDMAQEGFARILLHPERWAGRSRFTTYLFAILKNLCLDELRWRSRWASPSPLEAVTETPDPGPTPEEAVALRLERERVAAALDRLSPDQKAALVLREYHGLSYEEIATVMDWSEAKTKIVIYRARLALGQRLRDEGGSEHAAR